MEININEASSKECLAYFQAKLDEEAWEAKKAGKLVCWSASVAPPEFCVAMDIAMVYPETHAAGAGARKASQDLLDVAHRKVTTLISALMHVQTLDTWSSLNRKL